MKRLSDILSFLLLPVMFGSCIDNKYDLSDIDDSGGLSPALVLPIGTLNTAIIDFIEGAGIKSELLQIDPDTIYVVYAGSMRLNPVSPIPGLGNSEIITGIPPGIQFAIDGGSESIDIDIFKDLASGGSVLYPSNPRVSCTMRNYMGADITVDVNGIASEGNGQRKQAIFSNGNASYPVNLESAPEPRAYSTKSVTFDRTNGQIHELFSIAPERLSYDFSVNLNVPNDGKSHFIVNGKYVDVDYEIRIPLTFGPGTKLVNADTLSFDLSGEDFISNIDELTLWIDYESSLRTLVDLDVLFLDSNMKEIPSIEKHFHMDAAPEGRETRESPTPYPYAKGSFSLSFSSSQFDDARKARYAVLKSTVKTDSEEVNIHPSNHIKLKLSAYSKVNI
jgi:hypothetical protein